MANTMSKSELIQRIVEGHPNEIARKDVKGVIEAVAKWLQGTQEDRRVRGAGTCKVHRHQEARHEGAPGHQSIHKRTNPFQGKAGSQDREGPTGKSGERRRSVTTEFEKPRCHSRGLSGDMAES